MDATFTEKSLSLGEAPELKSFVLVEGESMVLFEIECDSTIRKSWILKTKTILKLYVIFLIKAYILSKYTYSELIFLNMSSSRYKVEESAPVLTEKIKKIMFVCSTFVFVSLIVFSNNMKNSCSIQNKIIYTKSPFSLSIIIE